MTPVQRSGASMLFQPRLESSVQTTKVPTPTAHLGHTAHLGRLPRMRVRTRRRAVLMEQTDSQEDEGAELVRGHGTGKTRGLRDQSRRRKKATGRTDSTIWKVKQTGFGSRF